MGERRKEEKYKQLNQKEGPGRRRLYLFCVRLSSALQNPGSVWHPELWARHQH